MKDGICFLGRWPHQVTSAIPYIEEIMNRGIPVHFVVSTHVVQMFPRLINRGTSIISLEDLDIRYRLIRRIHELLSKMCKVISKWTTTNKIENIICANVIGLIFKNPLPSNILFHVTKSHAPWLLCARGLKVSTFIGSWDHPFKFSAAGHRSAQVFCWNNDLAIDWSHNQESTIFRISYPFIFDYVMNGYREFHVMRKVKYKRTVVMYPFTMTSKSAQSFSEELVLVNAIISALRRKDIKVVLKPKPEEIAGSLKCIISDDIVSVANYFDAGSKEKMVLTQEYNLNRLRELANITFIINVATTFALDVALLDIPVVQLRFNAPMRFPALTKLQRARHTMSYVLHNHENMIEIDDKTDLVELIYNMIDDYEKMKHIAEKHSANLKSWIFPIYSRPENIKNTVDHLCGH